MWKRIVDRHGHEVQSGYEPFAKALRGPHQVTTKVEMLDEDLNPVEDGDLYSADVGNELTNFITDGNVDVDVSRGARRTAELTLLNPTAEFTPATQDFSSEGDWVGKMYLDRNVRIYRGLYLEGKPLYVPVGTFMIDNIDVQVEQNMSQVIISMSDRWKMIQKSFFAKDKIYKKGDLINDVFTDMMGDAGIHSNHRSLDGLGDRDLADRKVMRNYKVDSGESRGDILKKLAKKWNIDIYFDPMGILRTRDRVRTREAGPQWRYYWSEHGDGMMVNMTRSFSDDNLYNHVIVQGQMEVGPTNNRTTKPFFVEKKNTNPNSKFRISRMGDRVLFISDDSIGSIHEANKALAKAWELRTQISESIKFQAISNPMLEADDLIHIDEPNLAKMADSYRLASFNVPLVSSLQTLAANQVLRSDDI